jgi:hypothetical protein
VREALARARPGNAESAQWIEAWTVAGLLDARIQSARDAMAKRIWNPPAGARVAAIEVDTTIQRLLVSRDAALARVKDRLQVSRKPRRRWAGRPLPNISRRWVAGTILAVAVLGAGIVGVASGAWTHAISSLSSPAAVGRNPPLSSAAVSPPPVQASARASPSAALVSGEWTFDELRMGALHDQPHATADGAGEVVAFPTAFDRSVRLPAGVEPALCLGPSGLVGSSGALSLDLHVGRDIPAPVELRVGLAISPETSLAFTIGLEDVADGVEEMWLRVRLTWSESREIVMDVARRDGGESAQRTIVAASPVAPADAALCLWRRGDVEAGEVLIDNVRIQN